MCKFGDYEGFKECKKGSGICIWEGFFNDKNVNCPFDDCYDEGGCPVSSPGKTWWCNSWGALCTTLYHNSFYTIILLLFRGKRHSSGLGTKVTIGAVVLILGLLLLFMLCLFICRRCQVLCWSGPPNTRAPRSAQQAIRVEMTTPPGNVGVSSGHQPPTAPPLLPVTSTSSPVHEDKGPSSSLRISIPFKVIHSPSNYMFGKSDDTSVFLIVAVSIDLFNVYKNIFHAFLFYTPLKSPLWWHLSSRCDFWELPKM